MIGQTISHHRITEKLGEGGMGVVYKAEDIRLKRSVALKFLSTQMLGDEEQKARFLREAQSTALLDHPNIAAVYDIGEADGRAFMAMALSSRSPRTHEPRQTRGGRQHNSNPSDLP